MELEKLKALLFSGNKEEIKTSLEQGKDSTEFQDLLKHINKFIDWKHSAEHFREEDKYERVPLLDLMTMKTFDCSNINIVNTPVPDQIIYLEHLEILNLKQYWFLEDFELIWGHDDYPTGISEEGSPLEFPVGMENLKNLHTVDLSNNHLEKLPDFIFKLPKLKELKIGANYIYSLPKQIGDLKSLENLDLSYSPNLNEIPEEIAQLKNLKTLNLKTTGFSENSDGDRLKTLLPNTTIKY
ncbi:leucine-rich repeat domain-containing protein [Flagellimonas lutimaris]|jgi:hypothetical protein|uniref:leucine-rich repeat domain-containing protein n=1 Tax=Flagellimonas TaxID=444459 RepID=UPI0039C2931D|tara:strand:+ start:142021 stop:142740 length:720 start_codon:yes stop_codon:yes gene_type:complete